MTCYPSLEDAIAAHARLLARFGGPPGLRDRAALESALARPRSGYYTDLIQQAAALWESLSQNHPFVDGNKRLAVTATAAFLRVNGCRLEFDDQAAHEFLMGLYDQRCFRLTQLEAWLRRHALLTSSAAGSPSPSQSAGPG